MGWPASSPEGGRGTDSLPRLEEGRRPGRNEYTTTARNRTPKTRTRISRPRRPFMEHRSRTSGRLDGAERPELPVPALASLLGSQAQKFLQMPFDRLADRRRGAGRVRVRTPGRLRDDLVGHAELLHVARRDLHGFRRVLLP